MEEFVIVTGLSCMRATVGPDGKVTDSTGGMLTGLTMKQVRHMVTQHKWTLEAVSTEEPEAESEEEAPAKKKGR